VSCSKATSRPRLQVVVIVGTLIEIGLQQADSLHDASMQR
jgi:hypothetical protein